MEILDLPVGINATGMRSESDSMGRIDVPAQHYWGAQTQRSLLHFSIGSDRMPMAVYHAYGYIKKSAALVNARAGRLPEWKADAIARACDEIISGQFDSEFPVFVWQTGSGTQSHMNVNEVIANRAIQLVGGRLGSKNPIHPNDDVNMGQSSNDTFPTAMHIAAATEISVRLLPRIETLIKAISEKSDEWRDIIKIGRTHLQDAVPITLGQEWSGYAAQIDASLNQVHRSLEGLYELALGGTAVGTGLNAPPNFDQDVVAEIAAQTSLPFTPAPNKFAALASQDAMVQAMGALRTLAVSLFKVANDIRWLASGPRCGLGELTLPENEPGSSIMPGKVNPTQCEAMLMVCMQVMGHDAAVAMAGSQGNFELNVMRPLVIFDYLNSARILGDAAEKLRVFCIDGAEPNRDRIRELMERSLMLVTALSPEIGYDHAASIAHEAYVKGISLREAAVGSGRVTAERFDEIVRPERMVSSATAGA
jgi:fumarate hydratase class II